MSRFCSTSVLGAFFLRELRAASVGRFIHVFWGLALVGGLVPVIFETHGGESHLLLQWCLYILPLFALLAGIGSAQNEAEEETLLLSQPIGSLRRVVDKFLALWLIVAVAVVPLILPSLVQGGQRDSLVFLALHATAVGGIFSALGLAIGFSTQDRLKAYLAGLCMWLFLLVGFGLIALAAARGGFAKTSPQLWIALLMVNPLDAMRVGALLNFGKIPFDLSVAPPLGRWWLENPIRWYAILAAVWMTVSVLWAAWRIERRR
jgi:hypothetical protein